MDRTILVGVDDSTGSEDALRWAFREARLRRRPVTAMLARDTDHRPRDFHRRGNRTGRAAHRASVAAVLEQAVDRADAKNVEVHRVVVDAAPVTALEEGSAGAEMVVVGSRGHAARHRVVTGSVARGLVNQATVPVVVVRGQAAAAPNGRRRPVVVGVDGTGGSVDVLRWAAQAAALRRAPLRIVHALGHADPLVPELVLAGQTALLRRAQTMLDETVARGLATAAEVAVDTVLAPEAPIPTLLREAENAQLLVVGRHGRGGFADLLLGSVSQQCVAHAACPVAVIHTEEESG